MLYKSDLKWKDNDPSSFKSKWKKITIEKLMELSLLPLYHVPWLVTCVCISVGERERQREKENVYSCTYLNTQKWARVKKKTNILHKNK